jgi:biotin carboxyl carrier protein
MLEPEVKDTSKFVLCPMPGTVISVSKCRPSLYYLCTTLRFCHLTYHVYACYVEVTEGQTVMEGQEIAVVEAMKMQVCLS